jgi:hypothetical protein
MFLTFKKIEIVISELVSLVSLQNVVLQRHNPPGLLGGDSSGAVYECVDQSSRKTVALTSTLTDIIFCPELTL